MSVLGTTSVPDAALIQATLDQALKLPSESVEQPTPKVAPPQPAKPAINVSQAATDADKAGPSLVELPSFGAEAAAANLPVEEQKVEEPKAEEAPPTEQPPADDDADLPTQPAAENFKKLRGVVKQTRQEKRELEERLQELSGKLEKYEKGEVVPDVLAAKDKRIAELEPYEQIVNLKLSPHYQEEFVKPAIALREKLQKISQDYRIPFEHLEAAVQIENQRELNTYLAQRFDNVGAMEVKQIVDQLQDLGNKALQAEQEPVQALKNLQQEFAVKEAKEAEKRHNVFETVAKQAWNEALEKTKKEGAYKELIVHPTDTEFNKVVVEPLQTKAAQQYGALVKQLAANGLRELPPELAAGLARMVQLAVGGALTLEAKVRAEQTAKDIITNTSRINGMLRPSLGTQNGAGHAVKATPKQGPISPAEAAAMAAARFGSR